MPLEGTVSGKNSSIICLFFNRSIPHSIELLANERKVAMVDDNLQVSWKLDEPGVCILEAVVKDSENNELYRSSKVGIIVQQARKLFTKRKKLIKKPSWL